MVMLARPAPARFSEEPPPSPHRCPAHHNRAKHEPSRRRCAHLSLEVELRVLRIEQHRAQLAILRLRRRVVPGRELDAEALGVGVRVDGRVAAVEGNPFDKNPSKRKILRKILS